MTLYQWLRAEPGRRLPLDQVHIDDAREAVAEAARDGWHLWISYRGNYIEAICELDLRRRMAVDQLREQGLRPLAKCSAPVPPHYEPR